MPKPPTPHSPTISVSMPTGPPTLQRTSPSTASSSTKLIAPSVLKYVHNASAYAYQTVPSDITPVVFNTGVNAPWQFFLWAHTILDYKNSYANYQNYTTIKNIPAANRSQSAIVLHDVPDNAPIKSLVHTMTYYGIEATYLTHDCCYNAIDTTVLNTLVSAVQAG